MIAQRTLVLALLSLVLAACGGGGGGGGSGSLGGGTTPPPGGGSSNNPPALPEPADWEQHSAENSQVRMSLTGGSLLITWIDLFDDELGFRVERRVGEGSWEVMEALPAMTGGLGFWVRTVPVAARYRVAVTLEGRSLPLHSPGNETEIAIDPAPANPPTIQIDQSEPVRGAVQVSVQNAEPATAVTYAIEGATVARVTGGGSFPATLPAQHLVDGERQLRVHIEKSPGLTVTHLRSLQVDNPAPAVLLYLISSPPPFLDGPLQLTAQASSDAGITAVEFFVNGTSVHVSNTPAAGTNQYAFTVDRATLPAGANVFRVVATDTTNATAAMERSYTVDAAPTLNVTGLFDGMIASGNTVRISGDFSDNAAGANLTIDAGDLRVLRTRNSPFAVDFSLAGVPPGEHSVSIRVQDSLGKITSRYYRVIVPSTSLNYELLATDAEELLAADGGSLLYRKSSGAVVLRNAAGAETQFPAASFGSATYRMSEGRIVAFGQDSLVYTLDATGQATQVPGVASFIQTAPPIVRGPWVAWRPLSGTPMLKLYNLHTGNFIEVPINPTVSGIHYDVIATPGNEQLLFQSTLNDTPGIYSYNLATTATQLLVSGSVSGPRSDGNRFLWHDLTAPPTELMIAPLSNPAAATVLSTNVRGRTLEGGLVCWWDDSSRLFVNDGSVTTELTTQFGPSLNEYTVEDGRIIFPENDQMHVWSAANGERVWLDTLPTAAIQADGVAYFLTGSSGTLYRVSLP